MTNFKEMTVGQFLNAAESRLRNEGGYSAVVHCEDDLIELIHTAPCGTKNRISETDLPEGRAGEDAASELLEAHAPDANPDHLAFARDVFFPISFR